MKLFDIKTGEKATTINPISEASISFGFDPYKLDTITALKAVQPTKLVGMEDGGERMEFEGGCAREPATGKGRYELISPVAIDYILNHAMTMPDDNQYFRYPRVESTLNAVYRSIVDLQLDPTNLGFAANACILVFDAMALELGVNVGENYKRDCDLLPSINPPALERLAKWYELGAMKYDPRNWESGMSYSRLIDSATRHLNRYVQGGRTEDHLAAIAWNLMAYIHYSELGLIAFDDMPRYKRAEDI